jgi:hypothetical protein
MCIACAEEADEALPVSVSVVTDVEEALLCDEGVVTVRKSLQSAYYVGTVDVSISEVGGKHVQIE